MAYIIFFALFVGGLLLGDLILEHVANYRDGRTTQAYRDSRFAKQHKVKR